MNLKDVLMIRASGKILPEAKLQSNLFGLKLSGGSEPIPPGCIAWFELSDNTWTDIITGQYSLSHSGVSATENGGSFTGGSSYIIIPEALTYTNKVFELEIDSMNPSGSMAFLFGPHGGGIWGNNGLQFFSGAWKIFNGSSWSGNISTSKTYFSGKNVKIAVQNDKKWNIYIDNVLVFSSAAVSNDAGYGVSIGTNIGSAPYPMTIKRIRVYDNTILNL